MAGKWGIWCLPTKGWCHERTLENNWTFTHVTFSLRKDAVEAMEEMVMKHTRKDYEVRKYKAL